MTGGVVPRATYRVQLSRDFRFAEATALVPYLATLGVSHVYCSSYLRARAGSAHGYDIVDHNALNPELGDAAAFEGFVAALRRHDMGHVLDFVPNHMGVAQADNAWWLDVLEWGRESAYAEYFDIDWEPGKPELRDKVLLPFLGDHYGNVLERGELVLRFDADAGTFSVWYHGHRFPITPTQYGRVLGAPERHLQLDASAARVLAEVLDGFRGLRVPDRPGAEGVPRTQRALGLEHTLARLAAGVPAVAEWIAARVARMNGVAGKPRSFIALHRLLEAQHYRVAFWRVSADEINYRRFFSVDELAGVRVERPEVFARMHRLVVRLVDEGRLDGLRIDHIDGLFDPLGYCERLRASVGDQCWIVVEKILAPDETLRAEWPVQGTTGYEFLNRVNGLFVDPTAEEPLTAVYRELTGTRTAFGDLLYGCKKLVMNLLLGSELSVLTHRLDRLSESHWRWRDFTATSLREALKEVVACLPVYRTYVDATGATEEDRRVIARAVAEARRRSADPETTLFEFLARVLTAEESPRDEVLGFVGRVQQFTGPVMGKGLEDTACYRDHRLLSLNEVGGDPRRFGVSVETFHDASRRQAASRPHTMVTTATHDTKRGEDVRARLDVLSELADAWADRVRTWSRVAAAHKRVVDDELAPRPNDEYLVYQTLVGSWPVELSGVEGFAPDALAAYRERVETYLVKALREAKDRSNWRQPNVPYEDAAVAFVRALLQPDRRESPFLTSFLPFQHRVALGGVVNSLAQVLVKSTVPGVPDFYQGGELWDLALVDPDNRRPVDYARRRAALERLRERFGDEPREAPDAVRALLDDWRDGVVKLFLTWRLLQLRRRLPGVFARGEYVPLETCGTHAARVCAYARRDDRACVVVLAPRLTTALQRATGPSYERGAWDDTAVVTSPLGGARAYRSALTGALATTERRDGVDVLPVDGLFADLPAAALVAERGAG